jgi:hypothetical protein
MMPRRKKRSSEARGRGRVASRGEAGRAAGDSHVSPDQQRLVIAQQAARLVVEQGIDDYGLAKRKAAARLGVSAASMLPTNAMVEAALVEYQRLFGGERHWHRLRELRQGACQAMRFFADFSPRLVGPVLSGAVSEHSAVMLHLFADDVGAVIRLLVNRDIPFRETDRRVSYGADRTVLEPALSFSVDGVDFEALLLPVDAMRQPPISAVDGGAVRGVPLREVEQLANEVGDALTAPADGGAG